MKIETLKRIIVEKVELLARNHPSLMWGITLGLTALVSTGDLITGADILFMPLYFIPIAFGAWFQSRRLASIAAILATLTWAVLDRMDHPQRSLTVYVWNLVVQSIVFSTIAYLVPELKAALSTEKAGRIDAERDLEHAQRLTFVGKMAAGIAHELGTPLNVTGSYAQMIRDGSIVDQEARDTAGIIAEQVRFMTGIIRQMLDFARANDSHQTQQSVADLLRSVVSLLAPVVHQRHVALTFSATSDLLEAKLDLSQMQQVFSNIIMNAVQACQYEGQVDVTAARLKIDPPPYVQDRSEEWIEVKVKDNGAGIAPDVLPKIFDPFFTTKSIGEGTGLGLSVAWGIIRKHGGWISVESEKGKGTSFSVFLPLKEVSTPLLKLAPKDLQVTKRTNEVMS